MRPQIKIKKHSPKAKKAKRSPLKTKKKAPKKGMSVLLRLQRKNKATLPKIAKIFNLQKKKPVIIPEIKKEELQSAVSNLAQPIIAKLETPNVAPKRKSKISPYILDLKKSPETKKNESQDNEDQAQIIIEEILKKLESKNFAFNKIWQRILVFLQETRQIFQYRPKGTKLFKPIEKESLPQKSLRTKISELQFNLPKFSLRLPRLLPAEIKFGKFIIPSYWKKTLFSFIVFCFIFILPFYLYDYYQNLQGKKNDVIQKTSQALVHLALSEKAASAQDLYYTQFELQAASQNFSQARQGLDKINFLTQEILKLTPGIKNQFITAQKLVEIGEKLSNSAAILTATIDKINLENNPANLNLTAKLESLKNSLNLILPDLEFANTNLQNLDLSEIPGEYKDKMQALQLALPILEKNVQSFMSSADLIAKFLGQDNLKRYLLLFQNNHELRPTGGFIGSLALVDINQGNFEKINVPGGGPYDLQAGLKVNIQAPKPLLIMNQRWEFQDANWFSNLPTSAEKLMWFYEKSGGPTVDGLIFINATFLEKILAITGPIDLPAYNITITADNFFQEIQANVELNNDKNNNKPKQIIADLTPLVINRLLHSDRQKFTEILDLILNSLNEKEIQLYFTNFSLEKLVLNNNWGGELKNTDKDYLEIVDTNIAGEKTDAKIKQTADLEVNIAADGSIINTLTITKTHTGQAGELFYGVPNLDYLRIYVPKDSELLSAKGFESMPPEFFDVFDWENYQKDQDLAAIELEQKIDPASQTEIYIESNKTVFANWVKVLPGQTQTITLQYKLPFKLNLEKSVTEVNYLEQIKNQLGLKTDAEKLERYSLLWQKQSGKENFKIYAKIKFPQNLNYQIVYPNKLIKNINTFSLIDELKTDKFLAIVFDLD
jgi:hypothetical protein